MDKLKKIKKHKLYNTAYGFVIYWVIIATVLYITVFVAKDLNKLMNECVFECDSDACKGILDVNVRGGKYFIDTVGDGDSIPENADHLLKNCLITNWSVSHFVVHFVGGLLFPDFLVHSFIGGVAFEYYENKMFDCHDGLDIVMNTSGFIAGSLVNKYIL